LEGFFRFAWQSGHKAAVDQNSCLSGVYHKRFHFFEFGLLFHVIQNLLAPALKSHAERATAGFLHSPHRLVIQTHPGIGRPRNFYTFLEYAFSQFFAPVFIDGHGVIFKKDGLRLREILYNVFHLCNHIFYASHPKSTPHQGLRIYAEGTWERASPACRDSYHRIQGVGVKVILYPEKFLVDLAYKWQLVQIFYIWPRRVMNDVVAFPKTQPGYASQIPLTFKGFGEV